MLINPENRPQGLIAHGVSLNRKKNDQFEFIFLLQLVILSIYLKFDLYSETLLHQTSPPLHCVQLIELRAPAELWKP
jgi:hypothetical protein